MVLSIIILVLLIHGFRRGYRRGFVLTILDVVALLAATVFANLLAKPVGNFLSQLLPSPEFSGHNLLGESVTSTLFFNGLGFFIAVTLFWIVVRAIKRASRFFTRLPVIHLANALAGSILGVLIWYVVIFLALQLLMLFSIDWLTDQYQTSEIAQWIVEKTPGLTGSIYDWWLAR